MRSCGGIFDIEKKRNRLKELEAELGNLTDWANKETRGILKECSRLKNELAGWEDTEKELEDVEVLLSLSEQEDDRETLEEALRLCDVLEERAKKLKITGMLGGAHDGSNSIVSIHAGAGGTEAQDWAEMLLRMYLRWCERKGFKTDIVDSLQGEEAGIKSVTFTVEGLYAYGYLKAEAGIHRLVRISPFDSNKRRHTSFASVFVYPDIEEDIDIDINEADLRIDTYRASGAGGQHVNKTDSAVRITHIPTGIVVQCQNERSQHKNRTMAMKILTARLYEWELREQEKKMKHLHEDKKEIAWGSQIRSYVLQPYRMVKDHRTGFEVGNVDEVLDGNIDGFIEAFLTEALKAENP